MKDAKGHGSNGRGGVSIIQSGGLRGVGLSNNYRAPLAGANRRPDRDYTSDAARTVGELRSRMANTGDGHKTGLLQGIKNILGG